MLIQSNDLDAKLASLYATLRTKGSPGTTSSAVPISQKYLLLRESRLTYTSDDITTLRAQIAELYKTQNTHLQTIKSLESGLSSLQQAEGQLKREYHPTLFLLTNEDYLICGHGVEIWNYEQRCMVKHFVRRINKYRLILLICSIIINVVAITR